MQRKPEWLKVKTSASEKRQAVETLLQKLTLSTVCSEASCPNICECFGRGTATFMILGRECTRNCTFCCVGRETPRPLDPDEPKNVAKATAELGLRHVVVTSVTRDDLPDGGAGHFAETIRQIRSACPDTVVEVLIPDFKGDGAALRTVTDAAPDIVNHNVETVKRLYPEVRPMAVYERSLDLLAHVKKNAPNIYTKSGVMVGLGETEEEVVEVMRDLRSVGCDILTVGQYLAPSKQHHPVVEYVHPDVFASYKETAERLGFSYVASAPLVRSSYNADRANAALRIL